MPIHVPGKRNKRNKKVGGKRSAVAVLQLTAMVDMFTVLAVFFTSKLCNDRPNFISS